MKKLLVYTFSRLLFRAVLPRNLRKKVRSVPGLSQLEHTVGVEQTMRRYLLYFLMPLWIIAGLLNWYHHRRTKIEKTVGTHESMIHMLIVLPFMVVSFMICLHWDQFLALVKVGSEPARFELRAKRPPPSRGFTSGILAAVSGLVVLPYAEEFWRCYRYDHTLDPHPPADEFHSGLSADRPTTTNA